MPNSAQSISQEMNAQPVAAGHFGSHPCSRRELVNRNCCSRSSLWVVMVPGHQGRFPTWGTMLAARKFKSLEKRVYQAQEIVMVAGKTRAPMPVTARGMTAGYSA